MAKYTATLSAQSTQVYVCDVNKPRGCDTWFGTASVTGTFGGGTVTFNGSYDGGTTIFPLTQDGTASAAAVTAAGALNLRLGSTATIAVTPLKIYASIGTATNPSVSIVIVDNN